MYIDEHDTIKAFRFLNITLNEAQASNLSNINKLLIKLEIEERILIEEVKPYEVRFRNYEDVYERPI